MVNSVVKARLNWRFEVIGMLVIVLHLFGVACGSVITRPISCLKGSHPAQRASWLFGRSGMVRAASLLPQFLLLDTAVGV